MVAQPSYAEDLQYSDTTWFLAASRGRKAHEFLNGLTDMMRRTQDTLLVNTQKCIAIFQWGGDARNLNDADDPDLEETCNSYNAAQNVIETTHAKICKSRILPMPLTSGGGYLQRKKAKDLGKALEGEFDENEVDQIKEDVVMDALVTAHGGGAAKVSARDGRVVIEHVPIEDVWFDPAEIRYRKPRCCYHVMPIDKFVLLEQYGGDDPQLEGSSAERRRAILKAASMTTARQSLAGTSGPCLVEVVEAWHLPSCRVDGENRSPEPTDGNDDDDDSETYEHDGRHSVVINGCTLLDEPWDGDGFPIEFYVPRKRRRSIWGLSMMFDLVAPQREYEKLTAKIQNQHQKMGTSGFAASRQANVNSRELVGGTFAAGFLVEYDGQQPPTPLVTEPVAQGTYQYKDSIPRDMMAAKGVSQLSAQSQLPAGLQQASGKALLVFEDFEAERFLAYHRELERWMMRLAWRVVRCAFELVKSGYNPQVRYRQKKGGFERMTWADVLPKSFDDLILAVFPVSQLSKQPSARFAQLQELLNSGAITVEQFKRLYDLPDLEAENQLDTADTDVIDRNLDVMITTGKYVSPEPFDNFELLIARTGKMINLCRVEEVPDDRIKLLRDYIEDAKALKEEIAQAEAAKAAANAPAPPMGGPPGMGAPPMPPPGAGAPPGGAPPMPPMPAAA